MTAIGLAAIAVSLGTASRSEAQLPFGLQLAVGPGTVSAGFGYPGCFPGPVAYGPTPFIPGPAVAYPPVYRSRPVIVTPGLDYWPHRHHHRRAFYGPGPFPGPRYFVR
jgi:hypothetical protein